MKDKDYSDNAFLSQVNTLWGSFEIPNHRLARTLLTQLAGLPLQQHMDRFDQFADKLERLPVYFMKFHGEHSVEKVMKVRNYQLRYFI